MKKRFSVLKIVIGVFFVIVAATQKMDAGPTIIALVIAAALIAWGVVPLFRQKKAVVAAPTQAAQSEKCRFSVAGLYYREDALRSVAQRHKDFGLSDADFIARHEGGRAVFEYKLKRGSTVTLVPEPTNEHDPNAIKVCVDGVHVGYVPASETDEVRQRMVADWYVRGWLSGGASKRVENGAVVTKSSDLIMYVEISPKMEV